MLMRIDFYLADQNPHRDKSRGITEYTHGLLKELSALEDLDITCIVSRSSYRPSNPKIKLKELPLNTGGTLQRVAADHLHPWLSRRKTDLRHYPKGFAPIFARWSMPLVGTVHDTILDFYASQYPSSRTRIAFRYWSEQLKRSLQRFDLVLTVSEFSRRCILEFCDRKGIRPPNVHVTYEGARWESDVGKSGAKDDYVLHLCSALPHKRTDTLLDHWDLLEKGRAFVPRLLLLGRLTEGQLNRVTQLRNVTHVPPEGDHSFKSRIQAALALILPSEIEGFGLPALESYYLGTPVVYVRQTAVEEVLGPDTPGGFHVSSYASFIAALEEVLTLDRSWIVTKAKSLREQFAWAKCAARTFNAYRSVL